MDAGSANNVGALCTFRLTSVIYIVSTQSPAVLVFMKNYTKINMNLQSVLGHVASTVSLPGELV